MHEAYELTLEIINYIFALIFNLEAIIKLIGYDIKYFTSTWWNVFDFVIVIGTDIGIFMKIFGIGVTSTVTLIRVF